MIRLAFLGVLAALAGCAHAPEAPLAADVSQPVVIRVATLSTNDCEARVAPVYTAAVVATERGAAMVRKRQLPYSAGDTLIALSRSARADLDAACPNAVLDSLRLASAESAVAQMQTILAGAR
jgi:hypothetical protein